jgi:transposase-like protein
VKSLSSAAVLKLVGEYEAPGLTAAEVGRHFGVTAAIAGVFLRSLREEGKLKSKGNTKGTRYRVA